MEELRKPVHVSGVFLFWCTKGGDAFENVPLLALQGIPACSEYLEVGGASRAMQREPPTACNPLMHPPAYPSVLSL